ncbi:mRNA-binding ribosome biosynthesis protein [Hanseniaspora uvarum]|nr:mRNA-binding ribosome biosynthesis protein [Hanseniaspora uvarum]
MSDIDPKTLFVRGIPFSVTDDEFSNWFSQIAPIRHAIIVKDENQQSRGFGFVNFAEDEDCKVALEKSRKMKLKDQIIRVDLAKKRDRKPKSEAEVQPVEVKQEDNNDEDSVYKGKPKLIVRNLPWSIRDGKDLIKYFQRFGTVDSAYIPRGKNGKMSGFGFVVMKRMASCKNAIENAKDLKIDGRNVTVDFAVDKTQWQSKNPVSENRKRSREDGDNEAKEIKSEIKEEVDEEKLNFSEFKERKPKNRMEDYSIFVRNVPYDATQELLEEHFSKFGSVKYALPVTDKETGMPKGTAFVSFVNKEAYEACLKNAPESSSTSLLISDDVRPEYVYQGRVLSITATLDRESASRASEKSALKRQEFLGKLPGDKDRRNLFLLNEGRITEKSKLAAVLTPQDLDIREKSYNLRVEQLKSNPSLHLSMTRLAVRNIPRSMTEKSLKQLARKAVVQFATEVKDEKRHSLSKEEYDRSTKYQYRGLTPEEIEQVKERDAKKTKKTGLVKQAKIIMEVKGTSVGRSRGYGFIEYKDHKSALMGLRWLNAHEVSKEEILDSLTKEEASAVVLDKFEGRRLVVEFAIENANVVKKRQEGVEKARDAIYKRQKIEEAKKAEEAEEAAAKNKSGLDDETKRIISQKRRNRKGKK